MKHYLLFLIFLSLLQFTDAQNSDCGDCPEEKIAEQITIYPNPATEYIKLESPDQAQWLYVYNVIGRKVKTFPVEDQRIYQIDDLPRGMYLVQVLDDQKHILTTKRVDKR